MRFTSKQRGQRGPPPPTQKKQQQKKQPNAHIRPISIESI